MSKVTVYVGLDYHKDSIQVCVMDPAGQVLANRRAATTPASPGRAGRLLRRPRPRPPSRPAPARPTSPTSWSPATAGTIDLAHPGYVARMKQSPDKTD